MPVTRPCLDCGRPTAKGSRCGPCERQSYRAYNDPEYRRARAALLAAEPWCHSTPCPYPDAGTQANPLTADHVIPLRMTAQGEPGRGLTVLCRRCNSAKRDRVGPWGGV